MVICQSNVAHRVGAAHNSVTDRCLAGATLDHGFKGKGCYISTEDSCGGRHGFYCLTTASRTLWKKRPRNRARSRRGPRTVTKPQNTLSIQKFSLCAMFGVQQATN